MQDDAPLTEEAALRAYATMLNRGDPAVLAPLLPPDFSYASQWVFEEITSRDAFLAYIAGKLATLRQAGARVHAEMAVLPSGRPCAVIAQGERDNLVATVLAEVRDRRLVRLDMCMVPSPFEAIRSGDYPA